MSALNDDVEQLERAVRLFVQSIKRPQRWNLITRKAGIAIDRPAAIVLQTLILQKGLRVQDLALLLGVEPPSVTRKTQELEQLGYLRRISDPQDRRAISLQVTPAGRKVAERLRSAQRQTMGEALADWPARDRHQFVMLFERFSENFANTPLATNKVPKRKANL